MEANLSYQRYYYHRCRNTIIQALGGRCCRCFSITGLQVHHISPIGWGKGRGMRNRLTEWRRAIQQTPTNLAVECEDCHIRGADVQ